MRRLDRYVPLGLDPAQEVRWIGKGLLAALALAVLWFPLAYNSAYRDLFIVEAGRRVLAPHASMPSFPRLLGGSLAGLLLLLLAMAALTVYHYFYHYQGSRSIDLMRRLPDRRALRRRCLTVPAAGAAACLLLGLVLLALFAWIYWAKTPEGCLPPRPWSRYGY